MKIESDSTVTGGRPSSRPPGSTSITNYIAEDTQLCTFTCITVSLIAIHAAGLTEAMVHGQLLL